MLVNQTKNDLELNALVSKRMSKKPRILFLIAALLFLALGAALLCVELFVSDEGDYFLSIYLLVFGALFFVFDVFFYPLLLKGLCKKFMQGKISDCRYNFTEGGYEIESLLTDGQATSKTNGNYASLTEIREYEDLWLLYLNKATIFALRKDGMLEGTADELTALLHSAVGPRYKTCFKPKRN